VAPPAHLDIEKQVKFQLAKAIFHDEAFREKMSNIATIFNDANKI